MRRRRCSALADVVRRTRRRRSAVPHQLVRRRSAGADPRSGWRSFLQLLIADEPTSALDVTVQRQVLDHLQRLTDQLGTALSLMTARSGAGRRTGRVSSSSCTAAWWWKAVLRGSTPDLRSAARLHPAAGGRGAVAPASPQDSSARSAGVSDDVLVAIGADQVYRESPGAPWRRRESGRWTPCPFRAATGQHLLAIVGESGSGNRRWRGWCWDCCHRRRARSSSTARPMGGTTRPGQRSRFRPWFPAGIPEPRAAASDHHVFGGVPHRSRTSSASIDIGDHKRREQAARADRRGGAAVVDVGRRPASCPAASTRVAIARALALRPRCWCATRRSSALDVLYRRAGSGPAGRSAGPTGLDLPVHQP